jgi:hypothetical protein
MLDSGNASLLFGAAAGKSRPNRPEILDLPPTMLESATGLQPHKQFRPCNLHELKRKVCSGKQRDLTQTVQHLR